MTARRFEPHNYRGRVWRDLIAGLGVGAAVFGVALVKAPQWPFVAVLLGFFAGLTTFAPRAFNQPADLSSIEMTARQVAIENQKRSTALCWKEITKAYFRSYEGTRWVFVSPGRKDLVFMVEGFAPQQTEEINELIRMNLESNKVEIVK